MARDSGGSVVLAFMLGAVAGAAAALLLAPATGEEARRYLAQKSREGRAKADEAAQKGREFLESQRETITGAIDRGREAYLKARGQNPKETT